MNLESARDVSAGLLAHLHLNASEAAVVVDETESPNRLIVYVYDPAASRRVQAPTCWQGYAVALVRDIQIAPH